MFEIVVALMVVSGGLSPTAPSKPRSTMSGGLAEVLPSGDFAQHCAKQHAPLTCSSLSGENCVPRSHEGPSK